MTSSCLKEEVGVLEDSGILTYLRSNPMKRLAELSSEIERRGQADDDD